MTDIWMAGTILLPLTSSPNPAYRGIIDIHPLAHSQPPFLCFESFICKLGDKTYGANLQQINSDPGWLSTPDIQWELLDAQHLSVFEALPYSLPKCVGKECQQRHSRPIICILPTRWHHDVNYQRKLILCNTPRLSNSIGTGLTRRFEKKIIIDTQDTVCYLNSKGKSASKSTWTQWMAAVLTSTPNQEWQHWSKMDTTSQTNFDFIPLTSLEPLVRSQHKVSDWETSWKTQPC